MTWPSDTLTNTQTDDPTDRPDLARAQLNSAILMVKTILGEAPAGSLLLTNQDEGAGNGLDADTVDGNHASAFAASAHNHSAANITSGTLPVERGGTERTSHTQYATLHGNGVGPISAIGPGPTAGHVLMSNGAAAYPTFKPLPTTIDGSNFFNGSIAVSGGAGTYTLDTGFGTDNFQWGFTGVGSSGNFIAAGKCNNYGNQFMPSGNTDGMTASTPVGTPASGHINFALIGTAGPVTFYVWARTNL